LALRDIGIYNYDTVDFGFGEAGLVFWLIIEAESDIFDFTFAEDSHTIIAFLAFEDIFIAGFFELVFGEIDILYLCFLDAENIRVMFVEPLKHSGQASA
jgi:hypothetical protein